MKFIDLPAKNQQDFIKAMFDETDIPEQIIEKDWWVSAVLRAIFDLPYVGALSFKGGTSLSKCWNLIERFSEDIDVAVSREFLGFSGNLSRTQVSDKLRRAACSFVREKLQFDIKNKMIEQGVDTDKFKIVVNITPVTTVDPEVIYVHYVSQFTPLPYIQSFVKVEVSGRSMDEPLENIRIRSMIEDRFPNSPYAEAKFTVPTVKPERTFIEKICLLHEEFSKETAEVRVNRMSRHLYDISMIMKTSVADRALADKDLFASIVEHRRKFIGLKGFDYSTLCAEKINIIPPDDIVERWRADYDSMCIDMMYGDYPKFDELITYIKELQERLKASL